MAHRIPLLSCWEGGEGVSGRDTGLLSSFSGIGRRPAGLEEMVVYVDGKFVC